MHASNVPIAATSFVGRERELAELCDLLTASHVRLVTRRGPGGSGKSRLALEAARVLRSVFADGVVFVPLAPLHDPAYVLHHVAQSVAIHEVPAEPLAETLARALRDKEPLLLVDNFDHVLSAGPELSHLLERTRALKLLVTSRAALRLAPEYVLDVGPLALPEPGISDAEELARAEAVALFCARAHAVAPDFRLTEENAEHVAEVCRHLDGLPLAVELAAARTNVLSPQAMLTRMDRRLALLTGGPRDRPARQRTLRATVDWSHDLLGEREQTLFRRLAVFAGGCTLEAVTAVCGLGEDDVIDGLAALVENSLLPPQDASQQPEPRFTMLETIREYALERLAESGEEEEVRSSHADYFIELAETAYAQRFTAESGWSVKLEAEHDNLRAALEFLRSTDPPRHLRLAGALAWFWDRHSHLREGRERLRATLGLGERGPRLARALTGAGVLATSQAETDAAFAHLADALAIWEESGDELERALTLQCLAHAHFIGGQMQKSAERAAESLALLRALARPELADRAQLLLAHALVAQGDVERAEALAQEGLTNARGRDDLRSGIHRTARSRRLRTRRRRRRTRPRPLRPIARLHLGTRRSPVHVLRARPLRGRRRGVRRRPSRPPTCRRGHGAPRCPPHRVGPGDVLAGAARAPSEPRAEDTGREGGGSLGGGVEAEPRSRSRGGTGAWHARSGGRVPVDLRLTADEVRVARASAVAPREGAAPKDAAR